MRQQGQETLRPVGITLCYWYCNQAVIVSLYVMIKLKSSHVSQPIMFKLKLTIFV